ncbi:MAG: hypothetical protein U1F36_21410 [Planctomycetota bacterium]
MTVTIDVELESAVDSPRRSSALDQLCEHCRPGGFHMLANTAR